MSDIKDILEIEQVQTPEVTRESIIGSNDKNKKKLVLNRSSTTNSGGRKPERLKREVSALLCNDMKDVPPIFSTDTATGYKQIKAKLGMKKPRSWDWVPFSNPARTDNAIFHHWRRVTDEVNEYPFAQFNKKLDILSYNDTEYNSLLSHSNWSKEETDHVFDLAKRFDLRFHIMIDRWDKEQFPRPVSIDDIKERYYDVISRLTKSRHLDRKIFIYDADHEKRRKEQLNNLLNRTQKDIDEEQTLIAELKKIETRKREREKKTQDLQKLISQAEAAPVESMKKTKKIVKKKLSGAAARSAKSEQVIVDPVGIRFPDFKTSGVSLRSHRLKLPSNLGQKKIKLIEQMLTDQNLEFNPIPTEEICVHFNELRNELVVQNEMKAALSTYEFELQSLKHQYEVINPGKTLFVPSSLKIESNSDAMDQD